MIFPPYKRPSRTKSASAEAVSGRVKPFKNQNTAAVALDRTLRKASRIKAVTIVIQWDDQTYDADWSVQKVSELSMAAQVLDENVRHVMFQSG